MIWLIILAVYLWLMGIVTIHKIDDPDPGWDVAVWVLVVLWPVTVPFLWLREKLD